VASSEEDAAVRLVLANDVTARGGGQNAIFANKKVLDTVRRADLEDRLYSLLQEVTAVATNDKCRRDGVESVEDGLDEVLRVVLYDGGIR
jgi:hypothetical protein